MKKSLFLKITVLLCFLQSVLHFQTTAQITQQCTFPTTEPTLCELYQDNPPSLEYTFLTPVSTSGLPSSSWTHLNVYINTTLTVNSPLTISYCSVRFGPNGKIVVTGHGGYLRSIGSQYFGCNGWQGIYVDGNGILNMYADHVEDAQYAVTIASNYAQITLQSCFFNRNITDIEVVAGIAANALITDNIFDCTSNTYLGGQSSTGIHTNINSILTFGLPSGPANIVRNHLAGAFGYSSTLNVRNGEFACNTQNGILFIGGRLDIRTDASLAYFNYFKHNRQDIKTRGTILAVQATQFTECETDNLVSVYNTNAQPIDLRWNTFTINNDNTIPIANSTHLKSAVTLDRSSGASGSGSLDMIEANGFYIDQYSIAEARSAVRTTGFPGTYDFMKINANTVNILAGGSGSNPMISRPTFVFETIVNSADGFLITANNIFTQNIDLLDYSGRFGFYAHDWIAPSSEHYIQNNNVIGTSTAFDYGMCAFHFLDSGPWHICDNVVDFTLRGFHFTNTCGPSVFGGNIMNHHHRSSNPLGHTEITAALLLETNTVIGPQFCRHNRFTANSYAPDWAAWHKGSITNVGQSRFDYSPSIPDEQPIPVTASTGWFFSNFSCADSLPEFHCGGEQGTKYREYLSEDELAVIEENQAYTPSSEVYAWEARRQLLSKLLRYPALKTAYPAADVFFDQHIGTSAGQFAQWDARMDQSMLIEPAQLEMLQQNREQLANLTQALDQLDATLATPDEVANADSIFFTARAQLLDQINSLAAAETEMTAAIETLRAEALTTMVENLDLLPQAMPYEQNQVFLNGLTVKKARGEDFSAAEIARLQAIASQCPEVAGTTVHQAMNRLPAGDPARKVQEYGEASNCVEQRNDQNGQAQATGKGLSVWPNPTESTLFLDFGLPFSGSIQVFALAGGPALYTTAVQTTDRLTIPAQQLPAGVYVLVTSDTAGFRTIRKFVVAQK